MISPFTLRHAMADIVAMVVYCFITGMITEIFISGMRIDQSLSSRLCAIPINILIAWPYGLWRDRLLFKARQISPAVWLRSLADVIAYVSFQSPVYALILLSIGASRQQIIAAVSANILTSMLTGGIYGYFLDFCRRLFGIRQIKVV
ncbi:L-alanine exporter AlaE [Erwinia sp. OLTSP20]|uniref:L-alanine exporter AlaE n=1 Tax=unclassified Erwinia TaxID=2622719 RepID=UPI000C174B67|nr:MULTISPECIES: L-alanine exporter AlaE [unclassified Erwinia]PIJ49146.1 L-alanine exporter AlaE [Erwinia sp. OAMSP11]PIJ70464.1 L-alanine exporter AlaE [Erwinia sp. OLSSP12]PIJ79957.1 L-alanine exporter AlaE [Erwinia sp. OLCASP19]PIJ81319.1 L-alanine exporter AlaE [Erwinia sp. OLMTSP26]PIJ83866.1 L-alanine exporter AlaE [Erwinia sp. OLMDSP33]